MNSIKKLISKALTLIMVFTMLVPMSIPVSAADGVVLHVSSGVGSIGDEIKLTVSLKNNPGLAAYGISMQLDSSKLTIVEKSGK